jgi:hypothetical protein
MLDAAIELDRPNDTEADRIARLIGRLPGPQDVSGIAGAHLGPKSSGCFCSRHWAPSSIVLMG